MERANGPLVRVLVAQVDAPQDTVRVGEERAAGRGTGLTEEHRDASVHRGREGARVPATEHTAAGHVEDHQAATSLVPTASLHARRVGRAVGEGRDGVGARGRRFRARVASRAAAQRAMPAGEQDDAALVHARVETNQRLRRRGRAVGVPEDRVRVLPEELRVDRVGDVERDEAVRAGAHPSEQSRVVEITRVAVVEVTRVEELADHGRAVDHPLLRVHHAVEVAEQERRDEAPHLFARGERLPIAGMTGRERVVGGGEGVEDAVVGTHVEHRRTPGDLGALPEEVE